MNTLRKMDRKEIVAKFGNDYEADRNTFIMGIDKRFTSHFAQRFEGRVVLETCTGGGFTTLALAGSADHVVSVELIPEHLEMAKNNIEKAGLTDRVTFLRGNITDSQLLEKLPEFDSAFLDPDWAVTGPDHEFRFRDSNTLPPADALLDEIITRTRDVALVLPPKIQVGELADLPAHELQKLFMGESHELYCLYFGELKRTDGKSEFRV